MKKILLSLLTVGAVTGTAFAATSAFFSDTETSTGNVIQAGAIDLKIDSEAHYLDMICDPVTKKWVDNNGEDTPNIRQELVNTDCDGSFALTDLVSEKFFNLSDVKPGDYGENTISMHVIDNDAWACIDLENLNDTDVDCSEPESKSPLDPQCNQPTPVPGVGELASNLKFAAWVDQGNTPGWDNSEQTPNADPGEGDNVWQGQSAEPLYFVNEPASNALGNQTLALAEPNDPPLPGGKTVYVGLAWCAGTMDPLTLECDGTSMGNEAQTDRLTANITFRVEQSRNNPDFKCTQPLVNDVVQE